MNHDLKGGFEIGKATPYIQNDAIAPYRKCRNQTTTPNLNSVKM